MTKDDCLFSDIQNLCNAVSDWLTQKINNTIETNETYPVPVVTSCMITAEPVNSHPIPIIPKLDREISWDFIINS